MSTIDTVDRTELDEVLARTPLVPLIGRRVRLQRRGAQHVGCCPFHGEKTPSFYVYDDDHFHCFGCGAHGDAISYVRQAEGVGFAEAVARLKSEAGMDGRAVKAEERADRDRADAEARRAADARRAEQGADQVADHGRRRGVARRMWLDSSPLADTPGARYLAGRAIAEPADGWPGTVIRWHAGMASLIVAATADGVVQAVQRVHVAPDGRKAEATPDRPVKITNGVLTGAVARLPGDASGPLLVAEGPETGLSVWTATGYETWVSFGSMAGLALPVGRAVVVCRDDDRRFSGPDRKLTGALRTWRAADVDLAVATPWPARRQDRSDFNDTIQIGGTEAVRARIAAALDRTSTPIRRVSLKAAHQAIGRVIGEFFQMAMTEAEPGSAVPAWAAKADLGVGKSHLARLHAAVTLAALRERSDGRNVAIAVPTHRLAGEQAGLFDMLAEARASGLTAEIWRGRAAADPERPGSKMCRDLDAVREAQRLRLDPIEETVCGGCKHRETCSYLAQRTKRADLWMVPHNLLFEKKPAALGTLAAVVVDENPIAAAMIGDDSYSPILLSTDTLGRHDPIEGDKLAAQRLGYLRHAAKEILDSTTDGPLTAEIFGAAAFTAEMATEARGLEWRTLVKPTLTPAMKPRERQAAFASAERNADHGRRVMFWTALAALLTPGGPSESGWAALVTEQGEAGASRAIELKGRRDVKAGWQVPTLHLDATMRPELLRIVWPTLELRAALQVEAPHQHIRQADRAFALSMLDVDAVKDKKSAERRHRARNVRRLHAVISREARRRVPGRLLVVAQKRVVENLRTAGVLPGNVDLAHHNSIRGVDDYRDVAALIVVGRTLPPSTSVTRMAEALTGAAVPTSSYEIGDAHREMADGTMAPAEAWHHAHPIAEALRWLACEGELVQIIGRARGTRRGQEAPVDVLVLTDVPLPLPVEAILTGADLDPTPADLMLAAGGIALENARHASLAYPERQSKQASDPADPALWRSPEAAKKAFQRAEKLETFPYIESYIRDCPQLLRVDYQLAGQGQRAAVGWFDPAVLPDPAAFLAEKLGPLATCKVAPVTGRAAATLTSFSAHVRAEHLPPQPPDPPPEPPDPVAVAPVVGRGMATLLAIVAQVRGCTIVRELVTAGDDGGGPLKTRAEDV